MAKGFWELHGGRHRPEYDVWHNMIQRCTNPQNPGWENYGGRGITVCQRWLDSFGNFLQDMGERPNGEHSSGRAMWTLERKNNDGNYEPSNCYWATFLQQANNRRTYRRSK